MRERQKWEAREARLNKRLEALEGTAGLREKQLLKRRTMGHGGRQPTVQCEGNQRGFPPEAGECSHCKAESGGQQ